MPIRLLTQILTWTLFAAVLGLAVLFVIAYRGIALQFAMADYGLWLVGAVFVLMVVTVFVRFRAGLMMLERGQLVDAVAYCQPRSSTSLTVGRDEASANCYAAAEAHRRRGSPAGALALLDSVNTEPRSKTLVQMLRLARASALIELGRVEEGRAILTAVEGEVGSREARQALASARALLSGGDA